MAEPTIKNGEEQFFCVIYEGNGGGQRVGKFVPFDDSSGGTIANSCIFNSGDSADKLQATIGTSSTPNARRKMTISLWYKWTGTGASYQTLWTVGGDGQTPYISTYINNNGSRPKGSLTFFDYTGSGSSYNSLIETKRGFTNTSKWYHVLFAMDTTQSTDSDRFKIYVDGELQETDTNNYYSQNFDTGFGTNVAYAYGTNRTVSSGSYWFNGYIAELNHVDGQSLLPASFGETDTSTGRWVPSTVKPYPTTTTSIAVTVVSSGGNKYALDGVTQGTVTLIEGATYKFDQSDSSNSGHPLRFSTTSDGTHNSGTEFTSGVTTAGTPGSSGAYTQITVPTGTATLYYYCSSHSGMGGQANTQNQYGDNGHRLKFQDSSSLGDDTSGNTNDFTASDLASTNQTTDSPTQNFATFSPSFSSSTMGLTEGNLTVTDNGGTSWETAFIGKPVKSGKWYFEATVDVAGAYDTFFGVSTLDALATNKAQYNGYANGSAGYQAYSGSGGSIVYHGNNGGNYYYPGDSTGFSNGDKIGIAYDADTGAFWASKNNTWINSGNPSTGANPLFSGYTAQQLVYFGLSNATNGTKHSVNFGQRSFAYTPPTGFSALQQDNMPETSKGVSGFVWVKNRDSSSLNHVLYDSSRGPNKYLNSNTDGAEGTDSDGLTKFLKGGFATEDAGYTNTSGNSFVGWNWVANSGSTSSNSNGSIASVVQANQTAGFSIVQYTGTASNGSVGHGLSSAPEWIMVKILDVASVAGFTVSTTADPSGFNNFLYLNETEVSRAYDNWQNTAPTNSVFTVSSSNVTNRSGSAMLAYCWHSVDGFSKFGRYKANGNADGPFVYTGFKPAFTMIKNIDSTYGWIIEDNQRGPFNPISDYLYANATDASASTAHIDFVSNGFKIRFGTGSAVNNSTDTYIYMAFAENPFVGDGTNPVTAR